MASSTSGRVSSCRVLIPEHLKAKLFAHLFPGDDDEHGATLSAGISERDGIVHFLVRDVFLAVDGVDYVPGTRGYRELRPQFIGGRIADCRARKLAYFAVHNHGGDRSVDFSGTDMASHERGYPALVDLLQGPPAGALVFARSAAAGDVWFPGGPRLTPTEVRIVGSQITRWTAPGGRAAPAPAAEHDRQIRLFGAAGQALLRSLTVGVIGLGGVGSLVTEYLAKLGIGQFVSADPERVEISNVPRIVGASRWDARWPLTHPAMPAAIRGAARKLATRKTTVAARQTRRAGHSTRTTAVNISVAVDHAARQFLGCDYVFLAADTAQARLVFNAIVHQYFIPGIQIGSKIVANAADGTVANAFSVVRRVWPGFGCLWCSGLISPDRLAWEAKSETEQRDQRYGTEEPNPSVITLNAVGAAHAVNEFLFSVLTLRQPEVDPWWARTYDHVHNRISNDHMRPDPRCPECSDLSSSRFGTGDALRLPTQLAEV
jgi:ThiF family protein